MHTALARQNVINGGCKLIFNRTTKGQYTSAKYDCEHELRRLLRSFIFEYTLEIGAFYLRKYIHVDILHIMNTTSHTTEFIEEMKQALTKEKEQLTEELEKRANESEGDFQAKYPEYGRNEEENVTEIADYQAIASTTEQSEGRLKEIEETFERIEEGTYGVTQDGEEIPEARLRANPAATTLVQ